MTFHLKVVFCAIIRIGDIMVKEYDDFNNDSLKNVVVEIERKPFKLTQLKIEHFYFNSGERYSGAPVSTSIELKSRYDYEKNKNVWDKTISHSYFGPLASEKLFTNTYSEELADFDEIINKIEENDLRKLGNNYFTEDAPERFSHFEVTYNYYFKIVGTYDHEFIEFTNVANLLNFKEIIENETNKVRDALQINSFGE